jgi:hypothetical protein
LEVASFSLYGGAPEEDDETRAASDALVSPFRRIGIDDSDRRVFFLQANGDQDRDARIGATLNAHVSEQVVGGVLPPDTPLFWCSSSGFFSPINQGADRGFEKYLIGVDCKIC